MNGSMAVLEQESVLVDKAKAYLNTERTSKVARAELIAAFIAEGKKSVAVGDTVLVYCPEDERKIKKESNPEYWAIYRGERQ